MRVIIIGSRVDGHANVVREILRAERKHEVIGFIDDDPEKLHKMIHSIPVIGNSDQLVALSKKYKFKGGIVAIGDNKQRRILAGKIKKAKLKLINAVHPSAIIDANVRIGEGCYMGQGVIIVTGSKIGNCVNIHTGTTIDHDNVIEDGANLGPGVHSAGRVTIGKDAFLGTGTCIIPDCKIGEGVVAGAGTVIISNLKPFSRVVGVPAHKML
jgi:sugar O-acyltransferase (sialic acid O-acetyltransferase NeuD family)